MADVITVNYQCAVSTAGVGAFGISGAQMPVPFDPLFGAQAITISQGQAVVTTLGTDDLIIGLYRFAGCTSYAVGAGWNAIITPAGTSNVMEYQTFNSAQAGLTVPISGCGTNTIQTGFVDAFVAADGLGSLQQSSKLNTYIVLQTGMGTSKQNMYVVAVPGIGTSKLNGYAILQGQMNVINPKTGLTVFHAFPP